MLPLSKQDFEEKFLSCVRGDLTCSVTEYRTQKKKVVCLFREDEENVFVPRFYAITHLGFRAICAGPVSEPKPELPFLCTLQQTPDRPQVAALNAVVHQLCEKGGALLICAPGSGKTNIAIATQAEMRKRKLCNTCIVIHQTDSIGSQWHNRIRAVMPEAKIGVIKQNVCEYEGCDFVVASVLSIAGHPYEAQALRCDLLIVDEAHHAASPTYRQVIGMIRHRFSLGLTATPNRADGLDKVVEWFLGPVAFWHQIPPNPSVQVNCIHYRRGGQISGEREKKRSSDTRLTLLTRDVRRNRLIIRLIRLLHRNHPERKGLLLSSRVKHVERLYDMLNDASISAVITGMVHTDLSAKERRAKKRKREEVSFDKYITLSTYHMFAEAIDFDGDFVIFATPKVRVEQPAGRVTRGRPNRPRPAVFDIVDDDQEPFKTWFSNTRLKLYMRRGFEILHLDMQDIPCRPDLEN